MIRKKYAKSIAIALSAATVLQSGLVAANLFDVNAFAATGDESKSEKGTKEIWSNGNNVTTDAAVFVDDSENSTPASVALKDEISLDLTKSAEEILEQLKMKQEVTLKFSVGEDVTTTAAVEVNWNFGEDSNNNNKVSFTAGFKPFIWYYGGHRYEVRDFHFMKTVELKPTTGGSGTTGDSGTTDAAVNLKPIELPYGTSKEEIRNALPKNITFVNSATSAAVNWSDFKYNDKIEEEQSLKISGTVEVPEGFTNKGEKLSVTQEVIIGAKDKKPDKNPDPDKKPDSVSILSSVTINGSERVGKTLSATVRDSEKNEVTSGLTYKWYRLKSKDSDEEKLVGEDSTYKLKSDDKNKYIKLVVSDGKNSVSDITGKISKKSSSGGSSSSSSSSDDDDSVSISSDNSSSSSNTIGSIVQNADGTIQLVNANGEALTGWQQINGLWYLGDANGQALTGWQQVAGIWYLMNNSGVMTTGWQQVGGTWYFMNNSGAMQTGWQQVGGVWYFMNSSGAMQTGWLNDNGTWYYLNANGSMAANTYVDGYYLGSNGAWVK